MGLAYGKIQHKIQLKSGRIFVTRCQNVRNVYETFINTNVFFYFSWPYCIKCTWKFFKSFAASVAFYQNRPIAPPWLKKTVSNSSDNFVTKSFRLFTKRKLSILWNFPFRLSFNCVFSTVKCKLWSWKPPHGQRVAAILLKIEVPSLRCQILFFYYHLNSVGRFWPVDHF